MHADLNDPLSRRALGLVFLFGAVLVIGMGVQDLFRILAMNKWQAVPCDITSSDVSIVQGMRTEKPYVFQVVYRYDWARRALTGAVYRRKYKGDDELSEADRLTRVYPVGAKSTCYVNPANPSESVLVRDALYDPIGIFVFAVVAILPLSIYLLLPRRVQRTRSGKVAKEDRTFLMIGCVFCIVGGFTTLVWFFGLGMYRSLLARGWTETPCQIIHSEVRSRSDGGGEVHFTSYKADVAYAYQVAGRTYRASRYNYTERSTPWYYGKRGIVSRYPVGQRTTCYVNPADPSESVLTLGWRVSVWFGLWPLLMGIGGVWCLLGMLGVAGPDISLGEPMPVRGRWVGPVVAALAAGFTTQLFLVLGSDLANDWQAGRAEIAEGVWVAIAGLAMAGSMAIFIAVLRMTRPRRVLAEAVE